MQIITLQEAKDQLGVTFAALDTRITQLVDGIEAEIFAYLNCATVDIAIAQAPATLGPAMAEASLKNAVLVNLGPRQQDAAWDIWKGGRLARQLFPFRVPQMGTGSTS